MVEIFPEVDLEPDDLHTNPAQVMENTTAEYGFWLHNHGRMPAPRSHWSMRLGDMVLAEGDTVVPARDSVYVSVLLPPFADRGTHQLRLAADTTQRVVETNEANNGRTSKLVILSGWIDPEAPSFVTGPTVEPHGVHAFFSWSTDERAHGMIYLGTTPMLGDSVEVPEDTTAHWVQLDSLTPDSWYWFRVRTIDAASNWRESPLDSFLTHVGPLADDAAPVLEFRLSAAYPNPTSGSVRFSAELPRPAAVRLAVYDLQGRLVWEDPERDTSPGRWTLAWSGVRGDGTRARPGLYLAQIQLGDRVYRRRIALVR
jgi:hypothetical protein